MTEPLQLTDAQRAQIGPWRERWAAIARNTGPMSQQEKTDCRDAAIGLYEACGLKAPTPDRIIFVESPLVMRVAAGFAAAAWHAAKSSGALDPALLEAPGRRQREVAHFAPPLRGVAQDDPRRFFATISDATGVCGPAAATEPFLDTILRVRTAEGISAKVAAEAAGAEAAEKTRAATWGELGPAITEHYPFSARQEVSDQVAPVREDPVAVPGETASEIITGTAFAAAAGSEAAPAEGVEWYTGSRQAVMDAAQALGVGRFGLECAYLAYRMWAGGNLWSGYEAYVSFFQEIAGLPGDWEAYKHWRFLAEHSGPRIVHEHFCIICDRPELILTDEQGRPHGPRGPYVRWRDGFALYSLNGIRVPSQLVEAPETMTFEQVRDEPNAEVRRHMLDRFGGLRGSAAAGAWLAAGGLEPVDQQDITDKMQPSGMSIWRLSHGDERVFCKLYRANLADDEPLVLLWVVCTSTAKEVFLRVPPTMKSARVARDWTFGSSLAKAFET